MGHDSTSLAAALAAQEPPIDPTSVVVGLLLGTGGDNYSPVFFSEFVSTGQYTVPDGYSFLSYSDFVRMIASSTPDEAQAIRDSAAQTGTTVDLPAGYLVDNAIMDRATLIFLLMEGESLSEAEAETQADTYIASAIAVGTVGGDIITDTLSAEFQEYIDGYITSTIPLTVVGALTVAQATTLAQAGFDLANKVTYDITDVYTTIQAALANPQQKAALEGAGQVTAQANELDNVVDMAAFKGGVNLRTELDDGNDTYSAGPGNEEIVGGLGADTVNLTFRDMSRDTVVYQTLYDGQTLPVVTLTFPEESNTADLYRPGTVLTVTLNGLQYQYTVTEDTASPQAALQGLANVINPPDQSVPADQVVVGYLLSGSILGGGDSEPELVKVYLSDFVNDSYLVPADGFFIPANYFGLGNAEPETLFGSEGGELSVLVLFLSTKGGSTYTLGNEAIYDLGQLANGADNGQYVLMTPGAASRAVKTVTIDDAPINEEVATQRLAAAESSRTPADPVFADVLVSMVDNVPQLRLIGAQAGVALDVQAGSGADPILENPGQETVIKVQYSSYDPDYRAAPDGFEQIDRKISITIEGRVISADIVDLDAQATVAALIKAINDARAESAPTAASLTVDGKLDTTGVTAVTTSGTLTVNGVVYALDESYASVAELVTDLNEKLASQFTPVTSEIRVNTQADGNQDTPAITALADGGFVIVYEGQDADEKGVFAQRFNAAGERVGSEFLINTTTDDDQRSASVIQLSNGKLLFTWEADAYDKDADEIISNVMGRIYTLVDGTYTPDGAEFLVNTNQDWDQENASVTSLANGGFVVAWYDDDLSQMRFQRYDETGVARGDETLVGDNASNSNAPSVSALPDGSFVVAYENRDGDIQLKGFTADGTPTASLNAQIGASEGGDLREPSAIVLNDGSVVVGYTVINYPSYRIETVTYTYDDQNQTWTAGDPVELGAAEDNLASVKLKALSTGGFIAVFENMIEGDGMYPDNVWAREFNADSTPVAPAFQLNHVTRDEQGDADVAVLANGALVAAWESWAQDNGSASDWPDYGVFARIYERASVGDEPATVSLSGGDLVITTSDTGNRQSITFNGEVTLATADGTVKGIAATEQSANGSASLGDIIGEAAIDPDHDTTIVLTAATVSDTLEGRTFQVEAGWVEKPGNVQETVVTFSDNNADYYEGGKLSVTVAGKLIEAPMVAGDAEASVQNLKANVEATLNGGNLIVSVPTTTVATFTLPEGTDSTTAFATEGRFSYTIEVRVAAPFGLGTTDYLYKVNAENEWVDAESITVDAQFTDESSGNLVAAPQRVDSVSALVDSLNAAFPDDVASFRFDVGNNQIVISAPGDYEMTTSDLAFGFSVMAEGEPAWKTTTESVTLGDAGVEPVTADADLAAVLNDVLDSTDQVALGTNQLRFVAAVEKTDPLQVVAEQSYAGEAQSATFSLSTDELHATYSDGTTAISADRAAPAYFADGQVRISITPRVADPDNEGELKDGTAVTISADMGNPAYVYLVPTDRFSLSHVVIGSIGFTVDGTTVEFTAQGGETLSQFLERIGEDENIGGAEFLTAGDQEGSILIQFKLGKQPDGEVMGLLVQSAVGEFQGTQSVLSDIVDETLNAETALANLVAAINAETSEGGKLEGVIAKAEIDAKTGEVTLTAAEVGKETFTISDVELDYTGLQQQASASYSTDNAEYFEGGTLSLTIEPSVAVKTEVANSRSITDGDEYEIKGVKTLSEFLAHGGEASSLWLGNYQLGSGDEKTAKNYADYQTYLGTLAAGVQPDLSVFFGTSGSRFITPDAITDDMLVVPFTVQAPAQNTAVEQYILIDKTAALNTLGVVENYEPIIRAIDAADDNISLNNVTTPARALSTLVSSIDGLPDNRLVTSATLQIGDGEAGSTSLADGQRLTLDFSTSSTSSNTETETRYTLTVTYDDAGSSTVTGQATVLSNGELSYSAAVTPATLNHADTDADLTAALVAYLNGLNANTNAAKPGVDFSVSVDQANVIEVLGSAQDGKAQILVSPERAPSLYVATGEPLTVTADMVDNDAAASLLALHDTVRGKLEGVQKVVIEAPMSDDPTPVRVPYDGTKTNEGSLDAGLYVDFWYVGIGDTYYAGDGTFDEIDGWIVDPLADPDYSKGQTYFANMDAFLAHLETLPIVESASIVDGNIVITADRYGTLDVTLEIYEMAAIPGEGVYINTGDVVGTLDATLADPAWQGLIGAVELGTGDAADTLTLTSKEKVGEQFVIQAATLDTEGTAQVAVASFTDTENAYYEGGKVGVTVNGELIETDMLPSQVGEGYTLTIAGNKPFALTDSVDYLASVFGTNYWPITFNLHLHNGDEIASYFDLEFGVGEGATLRAFESGDNLKVSDIINLFKEASFTVNGSAIPDTLLVSDLIVSAGLNAAGAIEIVFKDDPITIDGVALTPKFENPALQLSVNSGDSVATLAGMTGPDDQYIAASPDINGAELTLNALKAEIESRIEGAEADSELKKIDSVAVKYNDTTGQYDLKFTAKEPEFGSNEITISQTLMTIEEVIQVSRVNLDDVTFETRDNSTGPAKVSLDVAGHTVTADVGIDAADTVRNLAQAVIDARDGVLATHDASVANGTVNAEISVTLPAGVTGDTLLASDGVGPQLDSGLWIGFQISGIPGDPNPTTLDVDISPTGDPAYQITVNDLVVQLNDQLGVHGTASLTNGKLVITAADPAYSFSFVQSFAIEKFFEDNGETAPTEVSEGLVSAGVTSSNDVSTYKVSFDLPAGVSKDDYLQNDGDVYNSLVNIELYRYDSEAGGNISANVLVEGTGYAKQTIGEMLTGLAEQIGASVEFKRASVDDPWTVEVTYDYSDLTGEPALGVTDNTLSFGPIYRDVPVLSVIEGASFDSNDLTRINESTAGLVFDFDTAVALTDTLAPEAIRGSITIDKATDETIDINFVPTLKSTAATATSTLGDFVDYLIGTEGEFGPLGGKVDDIYIIDGKLVIVPLDGETLSATGLAPKLLAAPLEETVTPPSSQVVAEYSDEVIAAFESRMGDSFYADIELVFMKDGNPTLLQIYMMHNWGVMDVGLKIGSASTVWSGYAYPDLANVDSLSELVAALNWLMQQDGAKVEGQPLGEVVMVGNTITFTASEGYEVDVASANGDGLMFQAGIGGATADLLELFMGGFANTNASVLYNNAVPTDDTWTGTELTGTFVTFDFTSVVTFDTPITTDAVTGTVTVEDTPIAINYTPDAAGATLGDFRDYLLADPAGPLFGKVESISIENGNLVIQAKAGETISSNLALTGVFPAYADKSLTTAATSDTGVSEVDPSSGNQSSTPAKVSAVMTPFDGAADSGDEYAGYDISMLVNGEVVSAKATTGLTGLGIQTVADLAAQLNTVPAFENKVVFADEGGQLSISTVASGSEATLEVTKLAISSTDFLGTANVSNLEVTGEDYVAPEAASITLSEFAGLTGDELITAGSYAFNLQVNGVVKSGTFTADGSDTVADYVAAVQTTVGAANATVVLEEAGLVVTTADTSESATLEVAHGGLQFDYGQQVPIAAVASALNSLDMNGQTAFLLTAKEAGPDPLDLSNLTHETADEVASRAQVIDIQFVNTALDNAATTPADTVVSVTLKAGEGEAITSSVTLSTTEITGWDETDEIYYVNVNGLTTTRAETVVAALKAKIALDWDGLDGVATVQQGVSYQPVTGSFVETTSSGSTTLRITSSAKEYLPIKDYSAAVTVSGSPLVNAAITEVLDTGDLVFAPTELAAETTQVSYANDRLYSTANGQLEAELSVDADGVLTFSVGGVDQNYTASQLNAFKESTLQGPLGTNPWVHFDNEATVGIDNLPAQQTTTNPGEAGGESFYGDAEGTIDQTKTNPDATEANEALYGAAAGTITDGKLYTDHKDGETLLGLPAEVAFTMPASAGSSFETFRLRYWTESAESDPDRVEHVFEVPLTQMTVPLTQFLSALASPDGFRIYTSPGQYDLIADGHADRIAAAEVREDGKLYLTSVATGNSAYLEISSIEMLVNEFADQSYNVIYATSAGNELFGVGSVADYFPDTRVDVDSGAGAGALGEVGSEETRFNLGDDQDHDYWTVTPGYMPFDDASHTVDVLSTGNSGADVVNNFQSAYDRILIEAALAAAGQVGDVQRLLGDTTVGESNQLVMITTGSEESNGSVPGNVVVPSGNIDLTQPFTLTDSFSLVAGTYTGFGYPYEWVAASGTYADLTALQTALNAGKVGGEDLLITLSSEPIELPGTTYPQSVQFTVPGLSGTDPVVFGNGGTLTGVSLIPTSFDLDTNEFGLITSAENVASSSAVNAADLTNVAKVTTLLNSLFDFNADGNDDALNASIIAVTAADDSSKTAIWAHQQSSANDATVDEVELTLLSVVNTVGDEFTLANLAFRDESTPG